MSDEERPGNADDASATAAAGESQESRERTFSQAEVDAIVARRVSKAEKAAEKRVRGELDTQPQAQKKETPPAPGSEDHASKLAALEARLALADAMAELDWKPSKEDSELLRDAFKSGGSEAMQKLAGRLKPQSTSEAKPVDDPAGTYKSPGAPSGAPRETLERDATRWTRDAIDRMRADGTFKAELEKFRASLPGGGGGLFRKRMPK